jgi:Fe-S cluster biogenesis protein NfuA
MDLSCPKCAAVMDVPDKALFLWRGACPGCKASLYSTTDLIEYHTGETCIHFVLAERASLSD